ncbi:MAG: DUF72 domain-containing protein [Candidatus Hydrogenedentota bacterium]
MQNASQADVYIGPAGWSYEDWKGIVYPPRMPRGMHPLDVLKRYVDMVEINSTYYREPVARYCASWAAKVLETPRFLFTAKLGRMYTHERGAFPGEAVRRAYIDGLAPLTEAGRLAGLLVQFPWRFRRTPENRQWLARVADAFQDFPLVVEFRHDSWDRPEVHDEFAARAIAFCNIDQPIFDNSLGPAQYTTAPLGYIRLHGRNKAAWFDENANRDERYNYLYTPEELAPWRERINNMRPRVRRLFVVTNNHYRGQAVVNALQLRAALFHENTRFPQHLAEHYPVLLDVGTPE